MGASSLIVLIIAAIAFSGIAILISKFVLKASTNKQKGEPYECGIPTKGKTWVQLNVGYYLFALIFLIFDVELVFPLSLGGGCKKHGLDSIDRNCGFLFHPIYGSVVCT
jgi:NADH:ubiquinone oxidoreductase subunit 3 (subunit A)